MSGAPPAFWHLRIFVLGKLLLRTKCKIFYPDKCTKLTNILNKIQNKTHTGIKLEGRQQVLKEQICC